VISGTGSLTKTAAAILQLDGNNTYTGATDVSAGTLIANHNNALGTTAGATTVSSGATVRVAGGLTIGEAFTVSGTGKTVSVDYGALHLISGTSSLSGAISLAADANVSVASGSTFTPSGALDGVFNPNKTDAGTLTLSNAGNSGTLSGRISASAGTLPVATRPPPEQRRADTGQRQHAGRDRCDQHRQRHRPGRRRHRQRLGRCHAIRHHQRRQQSDQGGRLDA